MTKNEFKQGDRVAAEDAKYSGIVTAVCDMGCKVRFADGEELFFLNELLHHSDLPDYDRKTAFLTRLQSLLREFDATIEIVPYYQDNVALLLNIDCKTAIRYKNVEYLTADNIMDFDKE